MVPEPPPTSGRLSRRRREDPSFLPPAPAQPSRPYGCALPASPQGSEGRGSVRQTPRPVLAGAPALYPSLRRPLREQPAPSMRPSAVRSDRRFAPFSLPWGFPSPGPARAQHTPFSPGWLRAPPPSCMASPHCGLRPFRPLQRLLPGPETESLSLRFSWLSLRPVARGEAERCVLVESGFALSLCVMVGKSLLLTGPWPPCGKIGTIPARILHRVIDS